MIIFDSMVKGASCESNDLSAFCGFSFSSPSRFVIYPFSSSVTPGPVSGRKKLAARFLESLLGRNRAESMLLILATARRVS